MFETVTRRVGNSIAVTIPVEFEEAPKHTYLISKLKNGGYVMVPKIENPLETVSEGFVMDEAWPELAGTAGQ